MSAAGTRPAKAPKMNENNELEPRCVTYSGRQKKIMVKADRWGRSGLQ